MKNIRTLLLVIIVALFLPVMTLAQFEPSGESNTVGELPGFETAVTSSVSDTNNSVDTSTVSPGITPSTNSDTTTMEPINNNPLNIRTALPTAEEATEAPSDSSTNTVVTVGMVVVTLVIILGGAWWFIVRRKKQ